MEDLNIKDYLKVNTKESETKKKEPVQYNFSLVFDNGSDFIIERSTKNKLKKQLCFISNENLLFIRDVKSKKDKPICSEAAIRNFFGSNEVTLNFKNDFFNRSNIGNFAYELFKLYKDPFSIRKNLIRYGFNPDEFIKMNSWSNNYELYGLSDCNIDKLIKIIRIFKEYPKIIEKNKEKFRCYSTDFLLFLYSVQETYSIDYIKTFLKILDESDSQFEPYVSTYQNGRNTETWKYGTFEKLLDDFNLDFSRFCTYLFRDLYSQGIDVIDVSTLNVYLDYLKMQKIVYGKVKDKYPNHLKESHDKVVLIYNLNQQYFKEKKIEELNALNKTLEYAEEDYSIIVAKTSQDLITEGINLHHCVGSYVNRVKEGECSIFFLRKTDDIDTSLITIEVRDKDVIQVRGLCERKMDDDERKFLTKWCALKGLKLVGE